MAIVLAVATAVGIMAFAMVGFVMREVQLSFNQANAIRSRHLAEAGIATGLAQLAQDINWAGPLSQGLGGGQYTVRVDTAVSSGSVKVLVSTGDVGSGSLAGAEQTIRLAVVLTQQPFAIFSNTTVAFPDHHGTLTQLLMQNTANLPRAIHTNNLGNEAVAVDIQDPDIVAPNGGLVGRITASSGAIVIRPGITCTGCNPTTNQPRLLFPMFNWAHYRTLAQLGGATGRYFANQAAFDSYIDTLPQDAQGYKTLNGIIFVEGNLSIRSRAGWPVPRLRVLGTIVAYSETAAGCSPTQPCGAIDIRPGSSGHYLQVAQNGEPALMAGEIVKGRGPADITGLIYTLGRTTNPTAIPPVDGFHLHSVDGPIHLTGAVMSQRIEHMEVTTLTYDPNVFQLAPSGLSSSWGWLIANPISWSSGK